MIVKINGQSMPWSDVPTPDISHYGNAGDILKDAFIDAWNSGFNDTSIHDSLIQSVHYQNDFNYYLISHFPGGADIYKASGWAVEGVLSFLGF